MRFKCLLFSYLAILTLLILGTVGNVAAAVVDITITANDVTRGYGVANPVAGNGFTVTGTPSAGDSVDSVSYAYATTTSLSPVGTYASEVVPSGAVMTNTSGDTYNITYIPGKLTIASAAVITWPVPNVVSVGTTLSSVQLNATANMAGTFAYTPDFGDTTLTASSGRKTLSVLFTPTDPNFATASATVYLMVTTAVSNSGITLSPPASEPTGIATDSYGNIYIADTGNNKVIMTDSTGASLPITIGNGIAGFKPTSGFTGLSTIVTDTTIQLNAPTGVAVDAGGNLYIADTGNHRVHVVIANPATKQISTSSKIVTIAGNGLAGFAGDSGTTALLASLNSPTGLAVDATGVYIADNGNYRVRKALVTISATGVITQGKISTIAGDGNPATLTAYGLALTSAGDLYISDSGNNKVVKMVAIKLPLVTVAGSGMPGFQGDGGLATLAMLNQPSGIATDGIDLYIADTLNNCVRKVSLATGVIATRFGSSEQKAAVVPPVTLSKPIGLTISSTGLFVSDTGNNAIDVVYPVTSAVTTANPPGGTYATTQVVTLTASKTATIYYQLNGGEVTTYTGPITIAGPTTAELIYYSVDYTNNVEPNNRAVYVFDTTAPLTSAVINDAARANGTIYSVRSTLSVRLSTPVTFPAPVIYFSTTGTAPTAVPANLYTVPITIPVTSTPVTTNVQFFAVDAAGNKEIVQSKKYTVVTLATAASPVGGVYRIAQTVTLAANDPYTTIYYTTDGSDPTSSSSVYNPSSRITISTTSMLKFRAKDVNGNLEQVKTEIYTIDGTPPVTIITPEPGSYSVPQAVTLTPNDLNATIYYTTTGIAPTTSSAKYTAPIPITKTTTLMYFAMDTAGNRETVHTAVYTYDDIAPVTTASLQTGTYASIRSVALTADDPKASIYYTVDGSTPTNTSSRYTAPITIATTTLLKYFAEDLAGNKEVVKQQEYKIITLTTAASPKGGVFSTLPTVELISNGVGATIYYTTDGTPPTTASTKYAAPLLMTNNSTTLQFFSVDGNGVVESVKTEIYNGDFVAPKTTATCGSTANTIKLVAIDAIDTMPKIQFIANQPTTTIDNTTVPAYTLTNYTKPLNFSYNTIIKFFATDQAGNTEPIKTVYCPDVTGTDVVPALYLETLIDNGSTAHTNLFVRGNVAPFATTTLAINDGSVTTSPTDGSFTDKLAMPLNPLAGPDLLSVVMTKGGIDYASTRSITVGPTTPTTVTVGTNNGVKGNSVRIPITFASGFQAAAFSIDIAIPTGSQIFNPSAQIASQAAALGKIMKVGSPDATTYRVLVMDSLASTTLPPLPDGIVGYVTFSILPNATAGLEALHVTTFTATDVSGTEMTIPLTNATDGAVNIVSKPGNNMGPSDYTQPINNASATLKGVIDSLYMLLYPATYTANSSADLNADGIVQINELQQVINSYVGL